MSKDPMFNHVNASLKHKLLEFVRSTYKNHLLFRSLTSNF
ncbi:protein of unknown function [Shewanella benthica]|uniref:Uncharacterized protein n=1 Tax=Shewanella benthica TaxID=43661 RepID=A0A330MAT6_9GAMM|nr:protein of unknown function [Shewanella benthica]